MASFGRCVIEGGASGEGTEGGGACTWTDWPMTAFFSGHLFRVAEQQEDAH